MARFFVSLLFLDLMDISQKNYSLLCSEAAVGGNHTACKLSSFNYQDRVIAEGHLACSAVYVGSCYLLQRQGSYQQLGHDEEAWGSTNGQSQGLPTELELNGGHRN